MGHQDLSSQTRFQPGDPDVAVISKYGTTSCSYDVLSSQLRFQFADSSKSSQRKRDPVSSYFRIW